MEAASIREGLGARAGWRPDEAAIAARSVAAYAAEGIGTFAVAVNPRGQKHFAGLVIGGALGLAVMAFGPATGAGLNPARWLGPALASGSYPAFWSYILGPVAGALLAALGYRALVLARHPNTIPMEGSQ